MARLERLTGIAPLAPDPAAFGAGLHQIFRNGSLQIHADFNVHPRPPRPGFAHRRVNAFLYLNGDWDDAWGGDLELWNRQMTSRGRRPRPFLFLFPWPLI